MEANEEGSDIVGNRNIRENLSKSKPDNPQMRREDARLNETTAQNLNEKISNASTEKIHTDEEATPEESSSFLQNNMLQKPEKRKTQGDSDETKNIPNNQEEKKSNEPEPVAKAPSPKKKLQRTLSNEPINQVQNSQKNVRFYLGYCRTLPDGVYIDEILKSWDDDTLEYKHGYVQWLFPNHYQSRVNDDAQPLSREEAKIFKTNEKIYNKLVLAYERMMKFYGINISDKERGIFSRDEENYSIRYQKTLLTRYHNHMRIERILAHMSVVGFRRYAANLAEFLVREIEGSNAPLRELARKSAHMLSLWKIYREPKTRTQIFELERRCFTTLEEMNVESNYFQNQKSEALKK